MEDEIYKAKDGLVSMMVNREQLVRERGKVAKQVKNVTEQVKGSLHDKDQALPLIATKQGYENMYVHYQDSIEHQDACIAKMKKDIQRAQAKVEQIKCTKNILLARKAIAETRKVIFHDLNIDNQTVDEMERRIERKEIYADVWEETNGEVIDDAKVLAEYEQMVGGV